MGDPLDDYARAQTRQQMVMAGAVTVAVVLLAAVPCALGLWGYVGEGLLARMRGEVDMQGNPIYRPPFQVEQSVVAGIDMAKVHGQLLPDWMIAASYPDERSQQIAQDNLAALRAEAGVDPNLDALIVELAELVHADPWANAQRIDRICWSWNDYLDTLQAPYWIDCTVMSRSGEGSFYTKSYVVLADMQPRVGQTAVRQRIVRRIDQTNVVEMYHGMATTPDVGSVVLVDRIGEFAVDDVWPMLDPAAEGPFAAAVRAEASAGVAGEHLDVLKQTAPLRRRLHGAVEAIRARRSCGSRFQIAQLPWDGLAAREHDYLLSAASGSEHRRCPEVTTDEATAIIESSLALAADQRVLPAIEALAAFLARGVAVHEARHVADAVATGGADVELPCEPCEGHLFGSARSELSAYLASFADPATARTSLYQACDAMEGGGSHAAAMAFILPALTDDGCGGPPPEDLNERARELEAKLLGRSQDVALPADFPIALPLGTLPR